jgi:hypothetical protein
MPIRVFEAACVVVVVVTLIAMARRTEPRALVTDYALLAIAGFLGEETCVAIYRFYAYAPPWDARLADVPVLVPLIWPLVILSARDVASALFPRANGLARAAIVGAIVAFDASLVEVVAVRAGLWSWAEPGHLGVPIIGILGWGYFAAGADAVLSRARGVARGLVIAIAPLTAHAVIQATWWGLFRWTVRGDLAGASSIGLVMLAAIIGATVMRAKRADGGIPLAVATPRLAAAALFFVLLVSVAPRDGMLWLHVACVAAPYMIATGWSATRKATTRADAKASAHG